MASVKVIEVLSDCSSMLTDEGNDRWTNEALLGWFNEAQRELVSKRPDALTVNDPFVCVEGAKQNIPAEAVRLIDVVGVVNGSAITKIDRQVLDRHIRGWLSLASTAEIEHYVYDPRDPKTFYLYPPAAAATLISIQFSKSPDVVVISNFATDTQIIGIDDEWSNALKEYILSQAWSKDAEFAGNESRSNMHMRNFLTSIGDATQADMVMDPK